MIYLRITFANYKEFAIPGRQLVYGTNIGKIKADPAYSDGICCNGRSVKNILEECSDVFVLGN